MNNHDDKKEKTEETFFNNLFEKKEKEQNEQLYKNEFYVLEEEMKINKDQNSLQFMHDALLNKLMLEDYSPFPPKNEEITIVNNQKEEKKKEDEQDKLIEEENEFLRSLHKINYLTFSPFGLSFFDETNKDSQNFNEDYLKEKEEKILHMIDFDYNNFEVTNDLLLNICQGFVDINKLKEENLSQNKEEDKDEHEKKILEPEKTIIIVNSNKNITNFNNINENKKINQINEDKNKSEEKIMDKSDMEFHKEMKEKKKILFYKSFIESYEKEIKPVINNKEQRKQVIKKWKISLKKKMLNIKNI